MSKDYPAKRDRMVKTQLVPRGIRDKGVLRAMGKVPRHKFVGKEAMGEAYSDHPLPIGHKQTISQPIHCGINDRGPGTYRHREDT